MNLSRTSQWTVLEKDSSSLTHHTQSTESFLEAKSQISIEFKMSFSFDRDIRRFVALIILFRSFVWTEKMDDASLVREQMIKAYLPTMAAPVPLLSDQIC